MPHLFTTPSISRRSGSTGSPIPSDSPGPPDPEPEPESRGGSAPHPRLRRVDPVTTPAAAAFTVELHFETEDVAPPAAGWLESRLADAARLAGVSVGRVGLTLFDDASMGLLHDQHCGDPSPTDVITFDLRDHPEGPVDGDLALGRDTAVRQAAARGHDARVELLLYALHGLLHLLGEDDRDAAAYDRMHRREDELLEALGVGAVFCRGSGASDTAGGRA